MITYRLIISYKFLIEVFLKVFSTPSSWILFHISLRMTLKLLDLSKLFRMAKVIQRNLLNKLVLNSETGILWTWCVKLIWLKVKVYVLGVQTHLSHVSITPCYLPNHTGVYWVKWSSSHNVASESCSWRDVSVVIKSHLILGNLQLLPPEGQLINRLHQILVLMQVEY